MEEAALLKSELKRPLGLCIPPPLASSRPHSHVQFSPTASPLPLLHRVIPIKSGTPVVPGAVLKKERERP